MSRLFFLLVLVATAAVAGVMFQVKYEVQALERELARVHDEIRRDQERIHVLRAEWSYLNQPARIAELARRHLGLEETAVRQIASVDVLPQRPEDFGYTAQLREASGPFPRRRPEVPEGWNGHPIPTPAVPTHDAYASADTPGSRPSPRPDVGSQVVSAEPSRRADAPSSPGAAGGTAINPVTGRPLPALEATLVSGRARH